MPVMHRALWVWPRIALSSEGNIPWRFAVTIVATESAMRPRFVPERLLHTFPFVLMALLEGLALNAHIDARRVLRGAHEGAIAPRSTGQRGLTDGESYLHVAISSVHVIFCVRHSNLCAVL